MCAPRQDKPPGFPFESKSRVYHFTVPGTPYAWKRAADSRQGKRVNIKPMVQDQKAIAEAACQVFAGKPPLFGPVKVFVLAVFDIPVSWSAAEKAAALAAERYCDIDPDADRILNQVLDGLKFVAFVDDNQVADCRCVQRYGRPARREVWLQELPAGNLGAAKRREKKWRGGGYNDAIGRSPCGIVRLPQLMGRVA